MYKLGQEMTDKETREVYAVVRSDDAVTTIANPLRHRHIATELIASRFEVREGVGAVIPDTRPPEKQPQYSHYFRDVSHLETIDVYRVLDLFDVTDQAIGHALKKLLAAGKRGSKTFRKDLEESRDTIVRRLEMLEEDAPHGR